MLQITQTAATVFRRILDQPNVEAEAIRLVPAGAPGDEVNISIEAVDRPAETDQPVEAEGVTVVMASELAPSLEDSVLDARETDGGADLFLRPQADTRRET
jgi:Fe-S cluster assembly iron-binding protein IscA